MPVTVAKVDAVYDKPVEINKAMDSSTAECSNTLVYIWFSLKVLISMVKYLLVDSYIYGADLPLCVDKRYFCHFSRDYKAPLLRESFMNLHKTSQKNSTERSH